jgi:DNA-binding CsgD family transcriptional regulator
MKFSSLAPDPIHGLSQTGETRTEVTRVPVEQAVIRRSDQPHNQLATLALLANDLAGEFSLQPLLHRILRNAVELLHCHSGSICTIDAGGNSYRKEVDLDVGCRSGEVFPLDEGVTGAVVRTGGAVGFDHYSSVPGGHIKPGDLRYSRAVIGVPIRLGRTIVGAFVVFGDVPARSFDEDDVQLLELFAIHAAVAIANSRKLSEATTTPIAGLTTRELQVTSFLERGWPDKLIARELGISAKTVEKHVGTILRKTGARNRAEVAAHITRADPGIR